MPRKSTTTTAATKAVVKVPVVEEPKTSAPDAPTAPAPAEKERYTVKNTLEPTTYITVRNGFNGKLVYVSKRTGERFVWDEFGAEQDMELQELKGAKNSYKAFFENNWFLIEDPEVIAYLGLERFYRNALKYEDFDALFTKAPDEIASIIAAMPNGQKLSVIYRAKQLIANSEIDSIKVITALESSLGVELIER